MCAQRRLRSALASAQCEQSFAVRMKKHWALIYHWAHSEDSDQIGQMPKLIWVFAGRTLTLLVLSCRDSVVVTKGVCAPHINNNILNIQPYIKKQQLYKFTMIKWQWSKKKNNIKFKSEDHWSCIAHLSAEDLLKSAVIEEKKFKHSPWAGGGGADNQLGPKFWCQQEGLITMVICCKFEKNVYSRRPGVDNPRGQNFDVSRNLLLLRSFATSFKKFSLKSDFIHFFPWFYTCI